VAYLDGVRFRDSDGILQGVATTVTVPDTVTTPRNYTVSATAMSQAGEHFTVLGLVRLAQVHTHGQARVGHSPVDDGRAYSQRDGALSLVLPYHAVCRPSLRQAGVHLREPDGWRRITVDEIDGVVRLVPGLIDHRSTPWSASPTGTKATSADDSGRSRRSSQWPWRWSWHPTRRT